MRFITRNINQDEKGLMEDMKALLYIDRVCYVDGNTLDEGLAGEGISGNFEVCSEWFKRCNDMYTILVDTYAPKDKNIVGYMSVYPISESLREQIDKREKSDMDIKATDIEAFDPDKKQILFFSSQAVLPSYRSKKDEFGNTIEKSKEPAKAMWNGLVQKLKKLQPNGAKEVLGVAISENGRNSMRRFGCTAESEKAKCGGTQMTGGSLENLYSWHKRVSN